MRLIIEDAESSTVLEDKFSERPAIIITPDAFRQFRAMDAEGWERFKRLIHSDATDPVVARDRQRRLAHMLSRARDILGDGDNEEEAEWATEVDAIIREVNAL